MTYGQKYYNGFYVIEECIQDIPVFYRIEKTLIQNGIPYCVGKKYKTVEFKKCLHAWSIEDALEKYKVIDLSQLEHINPYEQHQPYGSQNYYITVRYRH